MHLEPVLKSIDLISSDQTQNMSHSAVVTVRTMLVRTRFTINTLTFLMKVSYSVLPVFFWNNELIKHEIGSCETPLTIFKDASSHDL